MSMKFQITVITFQVKTPSDNTYRNTILSEENIYFVFSFENSPLQIR